nr:reverse transcriptase domain-containing protein [Tanacetum cinerariifolium]
MVLISLPKRSLMSVSFGPPFTKMPTSLLKIVTRTNDKEKFHNGMRCIKTQSKFVKSLTFGALILWARSRLYEGTNIFSWLLITCQNGLKRKRSPTNEARVVCKFLKSLFARYGTPQAIIRDRDTHFCNDQFAKVMLIYGVTHHLSIAYHPQTSGQVEVSNHGLKRILERTIGENHASWSDKLDGTLWAFRTAYKTPIGCTPYKLVYGKACHLPIELEHKAYWALKQANFDLVVAGDHRKVKTRWSRPFTIANVFPYGTVELSQANGPNFKVNGHRVKHYFGGDVPQLVVLDLRLPHEPMNTRIEVNLILDCPDYEVFHAFSFVLHPQELHILSFILGIQYPNLID